jgi:hypothetical protein
VGGVASTWSFEGTSAAAIRIRLSPGQVVHFDSSYNVKSLNLQCSADDAAMNIVDNEELVAFDMKRTNQPVRASASGF